MSTADGPCPEGAREAALSGGVPLAPDFLKLRVCTASCSPRLPRGFKVWFQSLTLDSNSCRTFVGTPISPLNSDWCGCCNIKEMSGIFRNLLKRTGSQSLGEQEPMRPANLSYIAGELKGFLNFPKFSNLDTNLQSTEMSGQNQLVPWDSAMHRLLRNSLG